MTEILENILYWSSVGLIIVVLNLILFCISYGAAKKAAAKSLQDEQHKFSELQRAFAKNEEHFKNDFSAALEKITQRENEVAIKENKTTEILNKVQQSKEEFQREIRQLMRENRSLRNDLTAARQRAKRLANRLTAEV